MKDGTMPLRFKVDFSDAAIDWDPLVDEVFDELASSFLEMPKGSCFIEYVTFEKGYETLRQHTREFADLTEENVISAMGNARLAFTVFRCILGLSPPEWACITTELTGIEVAQNHARTIDRAIRKMPLGPMKLGEDTESVRIRAMIKAGVTTIQQGPSVVPNSVLHRMDKADTSHGVESLRSMAQLGAPYPVLLYERMLGRPFATHRDSVSERVGEVVESAIKDVLTEAKVRFRETKRAERLPGFDQAPDFIVPDELTPVAVLEAKLTQDDGTARDKVARVQRLRTLRDESGQNYDVIACIDGRGFKVRREDMRRLLQATDGKVFTLASMHHLVENTRIREYRLE